MCNVVVNRDQGKAASDVRFGHGASARVGALKPYSGVGVGYSLHQFATTNDPGCLGDAAA
jgi:hypothetical protein